MIRKSLLVLLFFAEACCIAAQVPAGLSQVTQRCLHDFNENPTVALANHFFTQLLNEEFIDTPIHFAASTPKDSLCAQVWYWAAEYFYAAQYYHQADSSARQALPLLQQGNDDSTLADCLNILALSNLRLSRYERAIDYARQCYELDRQSGDAERIAQSLNSLAGLYISAGLPQEAEEYIVRGLELARNLGAPERLATIQGMASEVYHALGRDTLALAYAEEAYQAEMQLQRPHKAMIRLSQKATALAGMKRYAEARDALQQAIGFFRQYEALRQSLGISLNKLGLAYIGLSQNDSAVACFYESAAIFHELGDRYNEMHARQGLYETLWNTQPDSAHAELKRFNDLRDSVYDLASAESLARFTAEFGNDFLKEQNAAERTARYRTIALFVLLFVLLAIAASLWFRNYQRRQFRRIRELLAELEAAHIAQKQAVAVSATDTTPAAEATVSSASASFMADVAAVVLRLMPEGQLDTARVAEELHLSPSQFRRRMQQASGLTPANYILTVRMDEAKRLLADYPKYNITEVAMRCGFADNAHFTHVFQRLFGMSPTDYISSLIS